MKRTLCSISFLMILLSPASVGWQTPTCPPYTMDEIVESPAYVEFWTKQRRHGWDTVSYEKKDGKTYFMRDGIECKFW